MVTRAGVNLQAQFDGGFKRSFNSSTVCGVREVAKGDEAGMRAL